MRLTGKLGLELDLQNIPWVSWTPTYSSEGGTITSVTNNFANYKKVGKLVFFSVSVTITNAGSATGYLHITPPSVTPTGNNQYAVGKEFVNTGHMLFARVFDNAILVFKYDNSTPIATGNGVSITGWYRIA